LASSQATVKSMKYKTWGVFVFLLSCIGCTSVVSPQKELQLLHKQSECCQTFSAMAFRRLTNEQKFDITLNQNPVYQFSQGKSYFIAFERPAESQFVEVTSWLNGLLIQNTTLVYPLLTVLDKNYSVISTLRPKEHWKYGLSIKKHPVKAPYYVVQFRLPDEARYVVMHTDPAMIEESTPYVHHAPTGVTLDVRVRFSLSGNIELKFL
jgi:hypothetical protein